jgi:uncharacterized membrane protein
MAFSSTANRVLEALVGLGVLGLVLLALTALIGFEQPNTMLLIVSSVLIFLAPLGMLVHLTMTRELTREEKRLWIQELTSRRGASGLADYLTSHDRRTAIRRRVGLDGAKDLTSGEPPAAR